MLDLKLIRTNPEVVREALRRRHEDAPLDELLAKDEERRRLLAEVEGLKATRNRVSEEIAARKKRGEDASELITSMRDVSNRVQELDARVRELEEEIQRLLLAIPNIPHPSVPEGRDERDNQEVRRVGTPRKFDFEPLPHWELGVRLGILDFERAAKISGARFVFLTGLGARLARALTNFMLDLHVREHGYREVFPPFLVNTDSMTGTGQLPKFAEDAFKVENQDLYLIPTAEVPVTNMHRDEILDGSKLPLYYVGYSSCFRAEAGSYGRDTRGLIRMHQFEKVELVKFVLPETSYDELEKLVADAEDVLKRLGLPYRVMLMCTADLGFAQTKKYDPEVWMPSYGRYVEISSCSNFEDFQARRANIRFRRAPGARPEYPHTLNGSGLAIGRTLAAILENYQQADGSVVIPEALRPYMDGLEVIRPQN
ncbi:MAG: serine--tRNA ligase [Limnochordales bacterium]|nr:serine--tRNA ligase [Limnochordales bacterium]